MSPYPENDKTPKAPDKTDKGKNRTGDSQQQDLHNSAETNTKEASVSGLDDGQFQALLHEVYTYRNPKDREGKSDLFKDLLNQAEDDLRNDRATSASGSEQVRYYNTSATKRNRQKRQPSSVSENLTHGGSLNNLAMEELYEAAYHLQRPKKTVSARQREGGSLPCNVNSPVLFDRPFFEEETKRKRKAEEVSFNKEMDEKSLLLEHDSLNQNYGDENYAEVEVTQPAFPGIPKNYTTRANLQISNVNVDDCVKFSPVEQNDKNGDEINYKHLQEFSGTQQYSLLVPGSHTHPWPIFKPLDNKKVDENGNALGHGSSETKKNKKKKRETDKNVREFCAKDIEGHRSDIINDVDKLIDFIDGNENNTGTKPKANMHKSKLHKHVSTEEKTSSKKQRTRSKGKTNLQKSTSMEEMSTSNLEEFAFIKDDDIKVPLRPTKSNAERPRERRSWGNTEPLQIQNVTLYGNASAENLESADFRVVTKKKKSKKRRNSLSGRRQTFSRDSQSNDYNRLPSPDLRKSACSVPHSEKSDSSDVDSVHSLPIDTRLEHENIKTLSYADIAKNNAIERSKWNKQAEKKKVEADKEVPVNNKTAEIEKPCPVVPKEPEPAPKMEIVEKPSKQKATPQVVTQAVQTVPQTSTVNASPPQTEKVNSTVQCPAAASHPQVKSTPEFSYNQQNWPSIPNNKNNNSNVEKPTKGSQNNNKVYKNSINNIKNIKNSQCNIPKYEKNQNMANNNLKATLNNIHANQVIHNNDANIVYTYHNQQVPANIPDVQSIEKMQLKPQHFKQYYPAMNNVEMNHVMNSVAQFKISDESNPRTPTTPSATSSSTSPQQGPPTIDTRFVSDSDGERTRPPVVILSGDDRKEVTDITFGFDINEQLLTGEVCNDFVSRFVVPEVPSVYECFHDKIVNFIGSAWEDILSDTSGKVQYYSDL